MSMQRIQKEAEVMLKAGKIEDAAEHLARQIGYEAADGALDTLPLAEDTPADFDGAKHVAAIRKDLDGQPKPEYLDRIDEALDWMTVRGSIDDVQRAALKPKMVERYWGMVANCVEHVLESRTPATPSTP